MKLREDLYFKKRSWAKEGRLRRRWMRKVKILSNFFSVFAGFSKITMLLICDDPGCYCFSVSLFNFCSTFELVMSGCC